MSTKKRFVLETYGKSLIEFAKAINYHVKIQKENGEIQVFEKDIYICPLCMTNFFYFKDGEYYESETFSDDHYPPESVGGTQTIFVCKPCNDFYGSNMDYALKEYLMSQAFLNKDENAAYPIKFSYGGIPGSYKVNTNWKEGNMVQNVSFKNYPLVKDWMLDTKKNQWSFKMKISMPTEEIIGKALLRAAYLYCFANWGYDFAYSITANHIRKVLRNGEKHPLFNSGVSGDVSSSTLENGYYFITNPKWYQAFQVMFDIGLKVPEITRKVFVIIPGNTEKSWKQLTNFGSWIKSKTANTKVIKLHDDCVTKGFYTHYNYTWAKLKK
jgi:hypothetical protein